jgi:cystathionine beta-lyase/cystathionine gamma-synthase
MVSAPASVVGPHTSRTSDRLVVTALTDLDADLDELSFLCGGALARLAQTEAELATAGLQAQTRELLCGQLASSRRRYHIAARRLRSLRRRARREAASPALIRELAAEKAALADLLRAEQALLAGLVGAADWQSPSFLHSLAPAAGRQTGRIRPHWNDYKRDRHLDADDYERRYVEGMVDRPANVRALLTSCGMAAFTTVLSFLVCERRLGGPVLAGAGLYHESRLQLKRALPGRVQFVDECDTGALLRAIDELHPRAVFLDSLSNTTFMPVPELGPLVARLDGSDTYLVLDNTGLSVACQPFAAAGTSVRLLVFESLLKYAQLGLDRANAGVIVARADDAALLADYREHLGTNVADVAVHALPPPDRRVLGRRLARLQRNALFLAERLSEQAPAGVEIIYPGLPSHRCARRAAALTFRGGCLSIVFHPGDRTLGRERALVEAAVAEAAGRGVSLLAGSSFGFDTTRIYLTAARAAYGEPFVRVAAGTEHRLALEPLADALAAAVQAVAR